jgi:epoxide hydrolase-like predicted phosphatase
MIKAIIFDCFGVLAQDGMNALYRRYVHSKTLYQAVHDINKQSDMGLISEEALLQRLHELLDLPIEEIDDTLHNLQKNEHMFEAIERLKPRYKIGMLSNVSRTFMKTFLTEKEKGMFDAMVVSGDIGATKPDKKAYLAAAKALGVAPEECVMIDDREHNCRGAEAVGMKAIYYESKDQTLRDLGVLLADPDN